MAVYGTRKHKRGNALVVPEHKADVLCSRSSFLENEYKPLGETAQFLLVNDILKMDVIPRECVPVQISVWTNFNADLKMKNLAKDTTEQDTLVMTLTTASQDYQQNSGARAYWNMQWVHQLSAKHRISGSELYIVLKARPGSGPCMAMMNLFYRLGEPEDFFQRNSATPDYFTAPTATLWGGGGIWSV